MGCGNTTPQENNITTPLCLKELSKTQDSNSESEDLLNGSKGWGGALVAKVLLTQA